VILFLFGKSKIFKTKLITMQISYFTKQLLTTAIIVLLSTYLSNAQSWYKANNPFGGNILSIHETNDGVLLCGTNRGLYKSTDNGDNWDLISGEYSNLSTLDVSSTSSGMYISLFAYFLRRSYDGGQSWETIPAQDWTSLNKIIVNDDDQIFINTNNSVWRSSDDGETWTQLETGVNGNRFYAFQISPDGELFGTSYNEKIYRSDDNGDTWSELYTFADDISSVAFDGDNTVYAISRLAGMWKSLDNGDTWSELTPIPGTNGGTYIKTNSSGEVFIAAYDDGVYKSSDGGTTWNDITADLIDPTVRVIFPNSADELFVGTRSGGVSLQEGSSWTQKNQGITAIFIYRFISIDGVLYACSDFGISTSEDGGQTWQQSIQGMEDTEIRALAKAPNGDLYAGSDMLYRSEDGINWINISQPFPDDEVYVTDLLIEPNGRIIMATDEYGMCYSDNQGQNWTFVNTGLEDVTMAFIRKNQQGYYFTADGYNLYRSNDLSGSWEIINNGLTDTDITEFGVGDGTLYAITYSDGLFKSSDNGDSWTLSIDEDFNNVAVEGAEVYGSTNSVYYSNNNGDTWDDIGDGLPGTYIEEVTYVEDLGLFANVSNYGLYTLDFTVNDVNDRVFSNIKFNCYPNPFSESASLKIDLDENARVSYSIFNLQGQIVERSSPLYFTQGAHTFLIGNDLLGGIYLVAVNVDNKMSTRQIIKVK